MSNDRVLSRAVPVPFLAATTALAAALLLAACTSGASPAPAGSPSPSARPASPPAGSPSPVPATPAGSPAIDHPTGATDLVLRFSEGGGFAPASWLALQVPYFSLYGDGTVLYRPAAEPPEEQQSGDPLRFPALHVARMTEDQVQELLRAALVDAGLAVARARYDNNMVADAPTATFVVHAGGLDKSVSAYALGMEAQPGPDSAMTKRMATFAERLRAFDQEVVAGHATETGRYAPERFRGTLFETEGRPAVGARAWPWPTFGPDAFVAPPPDEFGLPSRPLSAIEVSLVGLDRLEGGVSGIAVLGPDGKKLYELGLRPLLPDETR